ncbi:GerAB/ArcD/ProY family transporter [Bacillus sp. SCS-151]|uniref:GerAB/ArcD/ProY family transporter n=1 Tax=Nanhaiella sioensis TaxID=3115293 RepID=UPI003978C5EF
MNNKQILTASQLTLSIVCTQVGLSAFRIQELMQSNVRKDAWITIIVGGLALQVVTVVFWILLEKFPSQTFFQITENITGPILGKVIIFTYTIFFTIMASIELSVITRTISIWALPRTPFFVISLLTILIGVYITKDTVDTIVRFQNWIFFLIVIKILMFSLLISDIKDLQFLFPLGSSGLLTIMKEVSSPMSYLIGNTLMFMLYSKTKGAPKMKLYSVLIANFISIFIFTSLSIMASIIYSPDQVGHIVNPLVYMFKDTAISIFQRLDLYFLILRYIFKIVAFVSVFYLASSGASYILNREQHKPVVPYLGIVILLLSMYIPVEYIIRMEFITTSIFVYIIPILLLFISIIFRVNNK